MSIDFEQIASSLLNDAERLLKSWFPNGTVNGREYMVGDLKGNEGRSLSINMQTGVWKDFASVDKGGSDLISLYAAMNNISNSDAAKILKESGAVTKTRKPKKNANLGIPPFDAPKPNFIHAKHGQPTKVWTYKTHAGEVFMYIARYDPGEKKLFIPFSWDTEQKKWRWLSHTENCPLYNLDHIATNTERMIIVVEGEKCADALSSIISDKFVVTTWMGGVQRIGGTDWSPLDCRRVLIWPDADNPGIEAANKIAKHLYGKCETLKMINVSDKPEKWDAAEAIINGGMTWREIFLWAKENSFEYEPPVDKTVVEETEQEEHSQETKYSIWINWGLTLQSSGGPYTNLRNAGVILSKSEIYAGKIWFDEFLDRVITSYDGREHEWSDSDDIKAAIYIQDKIGIPKMGTATIKEAIDYIARKNPKNEPKDWMESLEWDKTPRLANLMSIGFGSEESQYTKKAGENWIKSIVARIYEPGCKVDTMPVFEGPQGRGKSTALETIGGKWFSVCHEDLNSKDFYMVLEGNMIVEIAEMDSFKRSEVERIKGIISCRIDRYRKPYDRRTADHKRQCVFAGTTNELHWQKDATGGRRFWPISCGKINVKWLATNRDQLFAEAVHRYKAGEDWYVMPDSETTTQQAMRRDYDEWHNLVSEWITNNHMTLGDVRITAADVLRDALGVDSDKIDRNKQNRVTTILKEMGFTRMTVPYQAANGNRSTKSVWVFNG